MKKILLSLVLVFSAILMTSFVFADDAGKADIIVHYKNWTNEYDGIGSHAWGGGASPMRPGLAIEEEDGIRFEYTDFDLGSDELGFIAVAYNEDVDNAENWDAKQTGDVKIDTTDFEDGKEYHVYVFQGAETKEDEPAYLVSNPDKHNLVLVYMDPTGNYGENLGVHTWGSDQETGWGDPSKVFGKVGHNSATGAIMGAVLTSDEPNIGLLIYEGTDDDKKTGDVSYRSALGVEEEEEVALGTVGLAFVYSKGDAYTKNDNVLYNFDDYVKEAFGFGFVPMGRDAAGQLFGTYAPQPKQLFVQLSQNVASPRADEALSEAQADAKVASWFKVQDSEGTVLAIDEVHYNVMADSVDTFVVLLTDGFDITKDYTLEFDLGLEDEELNRQAEMDIDLDRQAPVITFISPSEILDKDEEERIILVPLNKKFDQNKFPGFVVSDNRDGDLTNLVYVPKGEFSTINTGKAGDYKIMLRVEDSWGNVTEETFIFRVTKDAK